MAKSKSFGGIPLTMSWYTAPFPSPSLQFRPHDEKPRQQTRQRSVASTATVNAEPLQQPPTVVNSGTGDRIELKLAPVQDEEYHRGARTGNTGGRGWGDRLGEAERVAWEGSEFERGSAGGGGRRDGDQATGEKGAYESRGLCARQSFLLIRRVSVCAAICFRWTEKTLT